jgi:hypothetical protein
LALSQRNMCPVQTLPALGDVPAVVEIGKGRGSGEAASQRANAVFSAKGGT